MRLYEDKDVIDLLYKLDEKINENLNIYWPNFNKLPIALYNNKKVFLINHKNPPKSFTNENNVFIGPWDSRFTGNTAISLNNYITGILNITIITPLTSFEKIYSLVIHELFHGVQIINKDKRFVQEMIYIQYPILRDNIELRNREREYLLRSVFEKDGQIQKQLIGMFKFCREKRKKYIGEYINYELAVESIEGTATYVEYKAFSDVSCLSDEYILSKFIQKLEVDNTILSNLRISCYSSGAALCILLDDLCPNWKGEYTKSSLYLYDFFINKVRSKEIVVKIDDYSCTKYLIKKDGEYKQKEFEKFNNKDGFKIILKGNMVLEGTDPINIIVSDNMILHKHFIKFITSRHQFILKVPVLSRKGEKIYNITQIEFFVHTEPVQKEDNILVEYLGDVRAKMMRYGENFYIDLEE
ncbi:hypothetical protein ACFIJ5_01805 [Haloimpatiens sp. FM7330]|uniref:hypothetical protein n=1 Tax=Haloimpatiens sp. FM7330 TaxID=3298610 RepID=UPI00363C7C42